MHLLLIIGLVVILGFGATLFLAPKAQAPSAQNSDQIPNTEMVDPLAGQLPAGAPADASEAAAMESYVYKDGTFTKSGTYTSPAGKENVTISLTIAKDVITDAMFKGDATNPGSIKNQGKFAEGYRAVVVGKKIDDVKLTVVNGSSLTPIGFMDALSQIKKEAAM